MCIHIKIIHVEDVFVYMYRLCDHTTSTSSPARSPRHPVQCVCAVYICICIYIYRLRRTVGMNMYVYKDYRLR